MHNTPDVNLEDNQGSIRNHGYDTAQPNGNLRQKFKIGGCFVS